MKKHIVSIIAIIVSFIASVAWGASPAFENFKAGMFSRSGNTIQIAAGATNASGELIVTPSALAGGTNDLRLRELVITNGNWTVAHGTNFFGGVSNYLVAVGPTTPAWGLPSQGYSFRIGTTLGLNDVFDFFLNTVHDSSTPSTVGSEAQITASGNYAIAGGYQTGKSRHLQFGIGTTNPRSGASASGNFWMYSQSHAAFTYEPGYSCPLTFRVYGEMGDGRSRFPGIMSRWWTNDVTGLNIGGYWELSLFKELNPNTSANTANGDVWAVSNILSGFGYYNFTNGALEGLYHRGAFLQSQKSVTISGNTNVALNFGDAAAQRLDAPVGAWAFYTTNSIGFSTNFQRVSFFLPANGSAVTNISYPAWQVATNLSLPTSLPGDYFLRFELESYGMGETNKVLTSIGAGPDTTFAWDADALDWFARASVTNSTKKVAINTLVKELKAADAWTNFAVIYIPLKDVAALNGENLKGNTFDIAWTGGVSHTNDGVGFDGSTGYANTGFNPTANGIWSQDSACMFVWSGTASPSGTCFAGVYDSSVTSRAHIYNQSGNLYVQGFNNNSGNQTVSAGSNFAGLFGGIRNGSTTMTSFIRSTTSGNEATVTSALINRPLFIGARNNTGSADNFMSYNLRLFAAGAGMDSTKLTAVRAAINKCGTALGWPGAQ